MSMEVQLKRFNSMERRPRMLKDFLLSENATNYSCSSSGFKSLPRRLQNDVVSFNHSYSSSKSTFQTVINTIRKNFTMRKSPSSMLSLPRSLSRKLSSRKRTTSQQQINTVKIKDIIRWKSFRDMQPSLPSPPLSSLDFHRYMTESSTTVTTTTTATTCSSSSSGGSSWSEGDFFTAWEAENDRVEVGKKVSFSPFVVVGNDSVAPFVGAKEELSCQEDEQHSPVSVLQLGDDEFSPFDQSLAYIKRRKQKLKQTVEKFESLILDENSYYDEEYEDDDHEEKYQKAEEQEWVEEKANQLLNCLNTTSSSIQSCEVVLDFFREELTKNGNKNRNNIEGYECEILRIAEDWINGSFTSHDIVNVNKGAYIKEMDRRCRWSKFEEEQENLALEIENAIFHSLVDDLLDLDGSY